MRVVVASGNPVKAAAARAAFSALQPDIEMDVACVPVESGVSDQPKSDEETRRGARNRARNASIVASDADYWVGLEGGIEIIDDGLMAFAWIAIRNRDGRVSDARSATLPLPDAVRQLIDQGFELGDANDRVFVTQNSKQGGGAYGLLTDGLYTRESIYTQTTVLALLPFINELYT
ncbi:MAG: inosine/xanthosine triphosphatase [Woeseiaceae bacterium]